MEAAQQALAGTPAAGVVSYADLIALAGARAVRITGGPDIDVPIGGGGTWRQGRVVSRTMLSCSCNYELWPGQVPNFPTSAWAGGCCNLVLVFKVG